ncbi:N-acetylglucosamine kinase [Brassicibacter mesophilus]|uniref:N-acetylglucosamine kinase n=1 Tax=Brassicibacter mesophilus TaxID=745119 RepID=UPI003D248DBD
MKFLGIDGGGTKTEFIVINEEGRILGYSKGPTCHYKQTSFNTFKEVIAEGINEVCRQINVSVSELDYSVLGIPGYGEILDDIKDIESVIENIIQSSKYKCANDVEVAWAGSLACKSGINIVAGTGTIGFGVDSKGNSARSSGWGPFCGDEGSAYWLGKKTVELFSKEADGRLYKTPLYDILRSELNIDRDFDLIDLLVSKLEMKRDEVGKLAKILYEAAKQNDKYALDIFSQAAYEHFITIKAIIDKLNFDRDDKIVVSYSGGVFNAGEYVLKPLNTYLIELNRNIELVTPILKPVTGAALYAYKLYFGEVDNKVIENLMLEEKTV